MWKVAEVAFLQVGDDQPTKEDARREAVMFRRKANFYSPEEPSGYIVLIGPNGEIEPLAPTTERGKT